MSRTRTADPFLSAAGVLATAPVEHTRQESADSGLGMGNNYSLPHTPEDFLTSIDDNMDGVSGKYILQMIAKCRIRKYVLSSTYASDLWQFLWNSYLKTTLSSVVPFPHTY